MLCRRAPWHVVRGRRRRLAPPRQPPKLPVQAASAAAYTGHVDDCDERTRTGMLRVNAEPNKKRHPRKADPNPRDQDVGKCADQEPGCPLRKGAKPDSPRTGSEAGSVRKKSGQSRAKATKVVIERCVLVPAGPVIKFFGPLLTAPCHIMCKVNG